MELRVRVAAGGDADGIAHVHTLSWRQGYRDLLPADWLAGRVIEPELWADRIAHPFPGSALFVAEVVDEVVPGGVPDTAPGAVIGYTLVGPAEQPTVPEGTVAQLYAIYVLAEHWGAGVGHRLHEAGLDAMAAAGNRTAMLWVLEGNVRATAFYERHGWSDDQTLRTEDLGGVTATLRRFSRTVA